MTGSLKDVIRPCSMLFVTKARGKMWNFQRSYYLAIMDFYVNMIERPEKIRFGPLSMIYRKAEFIEAKEIHSGTHIKKIGVFHSIDQFNGFSVFPIFSVVKGVSHEKQVSDPMMIQPQLISYSKSPDQRSQVLSAETARRSAKMTRVSNSCFLFSRQFWFFSI